MNLLGCKKAQLKGPLLIVLAIFFIAFSSILTVLILTNIQTSLTNAGVYTGVVQTNLEDYISSAVLLDNVLVFLMIAFFILLGLTSFKLATNPAFFVVSVVLLLFMGFISYFFNYIFIKLVSPTVFNVVLLSFPKSIILCTNLHWIALIGFVIESITLYGKKPKGQFVE